MSLLKSTWLNFAKPLWQREVVDKLDEHERSDLGQMVVLGGSVLVANNSVIAPYDSGFQEGVTLDRAAGTILVEQDGVYMSFVDFSGDASGSNTENLFNVRADGVTLVTIESTQKQSQEGVQASITGVFQLNAGQVLDVFLTGDSDVTLQNMLFGVLLVRPLDGITNV